MGESQKNIDCAKAIEDLDKKLGALSAPYEDALAYRVFQKSQDQFKKWIAVWVGVLTVVLLLFGFKGYGEMKDAAQRAASEYVKGAVITELQEDIKKDFARVTEQNRLKVMESSRLSSIEEISRLDIENAGALQEIQDQFDERIKSIATKVGNALGNPSIASSMRETASDKGLHAWAYYGIRSDGGWQVRYFKDESRNEADMPQNGDIAVATSPVNARAGVIEFDSSAGWVNKKAVGAIRAGNRLKVIQVRPVLGAEDFIWIEFEKI